MSPVESSTPHMVRCAVYTRKSTEEGLSQEFNSLDAQRECAQAYILSQRQQGWTLLPEHYDDGGFSGANLARPALQRLLAQIQAGKIDCVVIYKVDRLSRSLFDFARIMQILEKHAVSFVSVTQQLNSSTPMGRLTLHPGRIYRSNARRDRRSKKRLSEAVLILRPSGNCTRHWYSYRAAGTESRTKTGVVRMSGELPMTGRSSCG